MPSLDIFQLKAALNTDHRVKEFYKGKQPTVFIETGTHLAHTVINMQPYFQTIRSIELSPKYYEHSANATAQFDNIEIFLGDSATVLPEVLKDINTNAIFFLDGHWSSEDTGRGSKDCPLQEEIAIIVDRNEDDIIIIDDFRLFSTKGNEDWTDITIDKLIDLIPLKQLNTELVIDDRWCIFLRKSSI